MVVFSVIVTISFEVVFFLIRAAELTVPRLKQTFPEAHFHDLSRLLRII